MARFAGLLIAALALAGCAAKPELVERTLCEDPRPQVCTMEYNPVCGLRYMKSEWVTYASPCNACADDKVFSYLPGTCSEEE